ncbi:MAG TPA: PmoA family protein [bacterium]|mgnify:CR=1 FL=1|nr:PmoA family protein [bacterium]HQL62141.1 PmoA family protein [bacterium]
MPHRVFPILILQSLLLIGFLPGSEADTASPCFRVVSDLEPADYLSLEIPVQVPLKPESMQAEGKPMALVYSWPEGKLYTRPVQKVGDRWIALLTGEAFARECRLEAVPQSAESRFRFEDRNGTTLDIFEGENPVLGYNYGDILPEGVPEDRRRSCYVHPIMGLDGETVSGDFPKDHYHHRGLFWAWQRVTIGDKTYDPWTLAGMKSRFEKWEIRETGPVCAVLGIRTGWYILESGVKAVDERAQITVYPAGKVGRIVDVDLTLEALGQPARIAGEIKKGYSGFNFRAAPRLEQVITTVNGVVSENSNMVPSPWGDFSAQFGNGERWSGVSIFQNEKNPLFPSGWCLRPYGFLGVDFPGTEFFELKPGEPVHLGYRIWIHRGQTEPGKVSAACAAYLSPPRLEPSGSTGGK